MIQELLNEVLDIRCLDEGFTFISKHIERNADALRTWCETFLIASLLLLVRHLLLLAWHLLLVACLMNILAVVTQGEAMNAPHTQEEAVVLDADWRRTHL